MNAIFGANGYLTTLLERTGMMIKLNLITILFSLPVVTAGAAVTAMNYVSMKIDRGEEGYILKDFFRAFSLNLKQASSIWIFMLGWIIINLISVRMIGTSGLTFPKAGICAWGVLNLTITIVLVYAFAVLARFEEPNAMILRHAFVLAFYHIPYTVAIMMTLVLPVVFLSLFPQWFLLLFICGFSLPAMISAHFFNRMFLKFERV